MLFLYCDHVFVRNREYIIFRNYSIFDIRENIRYRSTKIINK